MPNTKTKRSIRNTLIGVAVVGMMALAIQPTFSYYSASDNGHATTHTGTLSIELGTPGNMSGTFDLDFANLVPGGHVDRQFVVENTGSVAATVSLTDRTTSNTAGAALTGSDWEYFRTGVVDYSQQVKSNVGLNADLGTLQPGQSRTYTLRKSLEPEASNNWQGVTVGSNVVVTLNQVH